MDEPAVETEDPVWKGLLKVGGAASLTIALIYLVAFAVYIAGMRQGPAPATVIEWLTLLKNDPLTGLFYLGFADILIVILFGPVSLALRAALERVSKTCTAIAMPLAFAGMAIYLASNTAFAMLSLSSEYAAATTEAHQSTILAAGHAIISISRGTGSAAGLSLVWLAALMFSILMLRSRILGKAVAWIGILSFSLLLPSFLFAGYTYGASTGVAAVMAIVTSLGGGLLSLVWWILAGLRLLKSGRSEGRMLSQRS